MTDTLSPDRERDAKIAEALGWQVFPYIIEHEAANVNGLGYCPPGTPVHIGTVEKVPRYSTDPVAFDSLMQEIGRRGLGPEFLIELALAALDKETLIAHISLDNVWQMFSAPQSTKAAAALAVLTETTNG